jgi:hypothetical protein
MHSDWQVVTEAECGSFLLFWSSPKIIVFLVVIWLLKCNKTSKYSNHPFKYFFSTSPQNETRNVKVADSNSIALLTLIKTISVLNYFSFEAKENLALESMSVTVRSISFKKSSLFWDVTHRRLISSCRRFGTPCRSYFPRVEQSLKEALSCPKRR